MRSEDEALLEAVRYGRPGDVRSALAAGADPNRARDAQGRTPLNYAASIGMSNVHRAEIFEELAAHKADPDLSDLDGFTPLHAAASYGRGDAILFLLREGADIDRRADNGTTPLHSAVNVALSTGNTWTVEFLLAQGADRALRNGANKTPLDVAREYADRSVYGATVVSFLENYRPAPKAAAAEITPRPDFAAAAAAETLVRLRRKLEAAPRVKLKTGPRP